MRHLGQWLVQRDWARSAEAEHLLGLEDGEDGKSGIGYSDKRRRNLDQSGPAPRDFGKNHGRGIVIITNQVRQRYKSRVVHFNDWIMSYLPSLALGVDLLKFC